MKRKLFLFALLLVLLTGTASADIGPKPSVRVSVTGLEGRECYGTLLSKWESTGPESAYGLYGEERYFTQDRSYWNEPEAPAEVVERWEAFQAYDDADGYYFLQCWWTVTEDSGVSWTYYPPRDFKLLLWFPETGEYRVSGAAEPYAFDSWYVTDLSADGLLELDRSYDLTWELISLVCRILITLALELGLAWLFHYRRRDQLLFLTAVNCGTQIALNVAVNVINFTSGQFAYVFWFVILELCVLILEALLYRWRLPRNEGGPDHPVGYAVAANVLSAAAGLWLSVKIPGIF